MKRSKLFNIGFTLIVLAFMLLLVLLTESCNAQTVQLGYVWDKNPEPDMSHYDLFTLQLPDCTDFWQTTEWPADSTVNMFSDTTIHYPNLLATIAHIHNSPIDTVLFQFTHRMSQEYLRAYIVAVDSVGNKSLMAVSRNAVFIGDRDSPGKPTQDNYMVKF